MALVLIADDHNEASNVLSAELMAEGHDVIIAATGQEAYARVVSESPDLVFLGPSLPVYDGYETCSLIKGDPEAPPRLPIILLGSTDLDRRRMERVGATGSLPREHGASELRELLGRLLHS